MTPDTNLNPCNFQWSYDFAKSVAAIINGTTYIFSQTIIPRTLDIRSAMATLNRSSISKFSTNPSSVLISCIKLSINPSEAVISCITVAISGSKTIFIGFKTLMTLLPTNAQLQMDLQTEYAKDRKQSLSLSPLVASANQNPYFYCTLLRL